MVAVFHIITNGGFTKNQTVTARFFIFTVPALLFPDCSSICLVTFTLNPSFLYFLYLCVFSPITAIQTVILKRNYLLFKN